MFQYSQDESLSNKIKCRSQSVGNFRVSHDYADCLGIALKIGVGVKDAGWV